MHIVYPVKLDSVVYVREPGGGLRAMTVISGSDLKMNFRFIDAAGVKKKVGGYDSSGENSGQGTRLTNIVGIASNDLLKECPKCQAIKDQNEFGMGGRATNKFRDQSECNDCR